MIDNPGPGGSFVAIQCRIENGNQLAFRSYYHITYFNGVSYSSANITLLCSTKDSTITSGSPYGPYSGHTTTTTIKGKKQYVSIICK